VIPLIYLAKAKQLGAVETVWNPRLVSERVYREVVTEEIEAGYNDARWIERASRTGASVSSRLTSTTSRSRRGWAGTRG
jgi:hypothetical protein